MTPLEVRRLVGEGYSPAAIAAENRLPVETVYALLDEAFGQEDSLGQRRTERLRAIRRAQLEDALPLLREQLATGPQSAIAYLRYVRELAELDGLHAKPELSWAEQVRLHGLEPGQVIDAYVTELQRPQPDPLAITGFTPGSDEDGGETGAWGT